MNLDEIPFAAPSETQAFAMVQQRVESGVFSGPERVAAWRQRLAREKLRAGLSACEAP